MKRVIILILTMVLATSCTYYNFSGWEDSGTEISSLPDRSVRINGNVSIGGGFDEGGIDLTTLGDISLYGDMLIRGDILTITDQEINGSFLPTQDNKFNLGSLALRWKDAFFGGTITTENIIGGNWNQSGTNIFPKLIDSNVGIGTIDPDEFLEVNGSAKGDGAHIGNAFIGVWDLSKSYAVFAHNDGKSIHSRYAIIQTNLGTTYLNSAAGANLNFRIGNVDKMILSPVGNLGIGTTTPSQELEVAGYINVTGEDTSNSTFQGDVKIVGTLYGGSPVKIAGINISQNVFSLTENRNKSSRFTLQNLNNGSNASSVIEAINDMGSSIFFGIGSSNFMLGDIGSPNITVLISRSMGDMVFANSYNQLFKWYVNPSDDNDLDNLVEIMSVSEIGLNLSTGSIYLGDFQTSAAGGAKVVKRSNANGALFGISNPIAGANPTSGAGYIMISDCGNYTYEAHSSQDTNSPSEVVHHLRGCLQNEDWRLNPELPNSSFNFEQGLDDPLVTINRSDTMISNNLTIGTNTAPGNISMYSSNGALWNCGPDDSGAWSCS